MCIQLASHLIRWALAEFQQSLDAKPRTSTGEARWRKQL